MGYLTDLIQELRADLSFSPERVRASEARRLELLIPEIRPDVVYPYEYIFYRITLFRPVSHADALVPGDTLRADLQSLLTDLTRKLALPGEDSDPVFSFQEISRRYKVSRSAVNHWRRAGLATRYFRHNGRVILGASRSIIEKFVADNADRVERSRRFHRLTDGEQRDIVERARRVRAQGVERPVAIARAVAAETGHNSRTVQRILQQNAVEIGLPVAHRRTLDPASRAELTRRHRGGESVAQLSRRFRVSRSAVYRAIRRVRLGSILDAAIKFIPSAEFEEPDGEGNILGGQGLRFTPPPPAGRLPKAPPSLPPYLRELYRLAILTREQERELFRRYNFVKFRMAALQERLRSDGYRVRLVDDFEANQAAAARLKHCLVQRNLRLVVSVAKRHIGPVMGLFELISEGNLCLMRAVECFDYNRGARFSTYATWALTKHFARVVPVTNYRARAAVTGQEELLQNTRDHRVASVEVAEERDHMRSILGVAIERLLPREQTIIQSRFGLQEGQTPSTLEEIASVLGVTRERIRQIEKRALEKLRWFVGPDPVGFAGA